ncbi:helix-turn-helix domain-containing protein [Paenibacillus sp. FSL H7-0331]|uniref:helix-turn-helix domain-containing protein n=1 Tax=Paenibacillus sp. FSL H7-0331 TaxID=1920421 RepID=UPI00096E725E|nr:helix-turn-helix domain-containing protein [Paenibacillus sp. FSL H7-0331]OMF19123.1 AraC family transcriptional regulator [Paenibacillus sp. FSL H7-0331]
MKMNLYYRMLLSYTPIFFVVISILIFSFFAVLNNSVQKQIVMTNEAITTKVVQAIDANLKSAERTVIKEIVANQTMKDFFSTSESKVLYDYFRISQKMDELSSILPFSNSIYVYNANSGKVLSRSGLSNLDQFGDRDFLLSAYNSAVNPNTWSDPRMYNEFVHESIGEERVVSLIKYYPYIGEKQGAIVVNIHVQALNGFIKDLVRSDTGPIELLTSKLEPFNPKRTLQDPSAALDDNKRLFTKSEYTGWGYVSAQSDKRFSLLSLLNDFWIVVGFIAILSGLVGLTYITHRNYKPIQAIAGRIQNYSKRKSGELVKRLEKDELKYIEYAIDDLLERAGQYEQLHKDDLLIRKRQVLFDWLEGHKVWSDKSWKQEMENLQLPTQFHRLTAVIVEIDRFSQFTKTYNTRDQYLLKFVLSNVLQEIAHNDQLFVWNEWFEPQQMAVVLYLNSDQEQNQGAVCEVMKKVQAWTLSNLGFTVSVGIGSEIQYPGEITESYSVAKEHVSYKPVFGLGAMIGSWDLQSKAEGRIIPHLQLARTIAKSFRMSDGQWQFHLAGLYQELKKGRFSQTDMETITNYMMYHLHKELLEMADEVNHLLHNEYDSEFEAIANGSETLDEWRDRLGTLLSVLENKICSLRSVKNNYVLIGRVKEYIELHYADPNLSLNQISDRFGMNPRYLSKLFKEEFGEKFIDYMLRKRLEVAQQLLLNTSLPVQDIAEQVGYVHVISFHRAFKNMFGLPPGDYRKRAEGR